MVKIGFTVVPVAVQTFYHATRLGAGNCARWRLHSSQCNTIVGHDWWGFGDILRAEADAKHWTSWVRRNQRRTVHTKRRANSTRYRSAALWPSCTRSCTARLEDSSFETCLRLWSWRQLREVAWAQDLTSAVRRQSSRRVDEARGPRSTSQTNQAAPLSAVHGDDFIAASATQSLDMFDEDLGIFFVLKRMPSIGPPQFGGTSDGQFTRREQRAGVRMEFTGKADNSHG